MGVVHWLRVAIGVVGLIALAIEYSNAKSDEDLGTAAEASAVQIIQLWTPHLYYVLLIVGAMVGCYIITRAWD